MLSEIDAILLAAIVVAFVGILTDAFRWLRGGVRRAPIVSTSLLRLLLAWMALSLLPPDGNTWMDAYGLPGGFAVPIVLYVFAVAPHFWKPALVE
jgi:hypothetical protein